jgi:hypothetical protein
MQHTEATVDEFGISKYLPLKFRQRGDRKVVTTVVGSSLEEQPNKIKLNSPVINAIARAFYWSKLIDLGIVNNGTEIAKKENLEASTVNERLRLSLLAPEIIESVLNGTQVKGLTMQWLTRNSFPAEWEKQKKLITSI